MPVIKRKVEAKMIIASIGSYLVIVFVLGIVAEYFYKNNQTFKWMLTLLSVFPFTILDLWLIFHVVWWATLIWGILAIPCSFIIMVFFGVITENIRSGFSKERKLKEKGDVNALIKILSLKDTPTKQPSTKDRGKAGEIADRLKKSLNEHIYLKQQVITDLGEIGDIRAVAPLIQALKVEALKVTAREALVNIGAPCLNQLIDALKSENFIVRSQAAWAISDIADKLKDKQIAERAVVPLITTLKDQIDSVRANTLEALISIRDARAVESLIEALKDQSPAIRKKAAFGLGIFGDARTIPVLIPVINDPDLSVRLNAITSLGQLKAKDAIKMLINALKDTEVEKAAHKALIEIGKPSVPMLVEALNDQDLAIRRFAPWVLGDIKDNRAIKPLISIVNDKDDVIRGNAVWALGEIADSRAVDSLTTALGDTNKDVHRNAAIGLGKIDDERAMNALSTLLESAEASDRMLAFEALGTTGNKKAVQPILSALKKYESYEMGKAVLDALRKMGCKPAEIDNFEDEVKVAYGIEQKNKDQLCRLGEPAICQLSGALTSNDRETGKFAANVLAAIGGAQAIKLLNAYGYSYLLPMKDVTIQIFRGGLGEPYCSHNCYSKAASYAMLDIIGSSNCGKCGRPVMGGRDRNYAAIPYEGKTLLICRSCIPEMKSRLRDYRQCCLCQKQF